MTVIVHTEFQGPGFVAVPNHVFDLGLSMEAVGVLTWMARNEFNRTAG